MNFKNIFIFLLIIGLGSSLNNARADEEVKSAHDAEKQINEIPDKILFLKQRQIENGFNFPTELSDVIATNLYFSIAEQKTITGAIFKYIARGVAAHPDLGPGWMAPNGYVWFDPFRDLDGRFSMMDSSEAWGKCKGLKAELPIKERFNELAVFLGSKNKTGYQVPQFLTDMIGNWFWTSSLFNRNFTYYFYGYFGYLDHGDKYFSLAARCGVHWNNGL